MKKVFLSFSILFFISVCLWAQNVPQTIDYQGRLADSDGNYLNIVVTVDFLIYDIDTGGTALWSETQDVSMSNGIFHVLLGSIVSFPPTLFDGSDRWLELIVSSETLSPRTVVASVPYSIKAETAYTLQNMGSGSGLDADLLDGQDSSDFMPATTDNWVDTTGDTMTGQLIVQNYVGIGTAAPSRMLTVNSTGANPIQWQVNALILGQLGTNGSGAGGLYLYDNGPISTVITANGNSYFSGGNVGIGTVTPDTELHVEGNIKIVDGNQGINKVLTSDVNGSATWQTLPTGGDITAVTAGTGLTGGGTSGDVTLNVDVPLNLSGNVANPNGVIEGENTGSGFGVYGENYGSGSGVYGLHISSGNYGLLGSSSSGVSGFNYASSGSGIYGYNDNISGFGVHGTSTGYYGGYFNANYNSSNTHVIHAEFTGTSSNAVAVYGESTPPDGNGIGGQFVGGDYGVYGMTFPTGSSSSIGVRGYVYGGSGYNVAIDSYAYGSGTNYGIYGFAIGGSTNYAGYFSGNVHVTGTFTNPSDERFKENVQPFKNALSKIKLMNVHTYNFIQMEEEKQFVLPEGEQIGLIAQELEEILPELVKDEVHAYDKNEGLEGADSDMERIEYKGINYIGLIPVLIEAIKELNTQNEDQQQKLVEQQRQINELLRSANN
ncbi:MAG: tail fiber domain-containing protein [Candidatus Cloacimonetes bacterium]|nr:tail fiber domain-containing protein [Candidatus Cloacimonadota bacterium]